MEGGRRKVFNSFVCFFCCTTTVYLTPRLRNMHAFHHLPYERTCCRTKPHFFYGAIGCLFSSQRAANTERHLPPRNLSPVPCPSVSTITLPWKYVVAKEEEEASPSGQPPPPAATSPRRLLKRQRTSSSPPPPLLPESWKPAKRARAEVIDEPLSSVSSSRSDHDEDNHGTAVVHRSSGPSSSSNRRRTRTRSVRQLPQEEEEQQQPSGTSKGSGTDRLRVGAAAPAPAGTRVRLPTRTRSKRKSTAANGTQETTTRGGRKLKGPDKGVVAAAAAAAAAVSQAKIEGEKKGKNGNCDGGRTSATDPLHGSAGAGAHDVGVAASAAAAAATEIGAGGGSSNAGGRKSGGADGGTAKAVSSSSTGVVVRERWIHVDPVQGAVDQADKVKFGC